MSMPFCSACTPFALEIMIGRVPFAAAPCEASNSFTVPLTGCSAPNNFVVLAAAVPASDATKNFRRDQRLMICLQSENKYKKVRGRHYTSARKLREEEAAFLLL